MMKPSTNLKLQITNYQSTTNISLIFFILSIFVHKHSILHTKKYFSQYFYDIGNIDEYHKIKPREEESLTPKNVLKKN